MEAITQAIISTDPNHEDELRKLRSYLIKNQQILFGSVHHIDTVLSMLDPSVHTLGYVYLLSVKVNNPVTQLGDTQLFYSQVIRMLDNARGNQVRLIPASFVDIFRILVRTFRSNAIKLVRPLLRASTLLSGELSNIGETGALTPLHALLLQACLLARCYHVADSVLARDLSEINPNETALSITDYLLFCYYAGMVHVGLKRFKEALRMFQLAISAPALALSAIVVEAYKKFILVSLIVHGKVLPFPKYTATVVNRATKLVTPPPYTELATAYSTNSSDELHTVATKYAEVFQSDHNFGLVLQVIKSMYYRNIQRNTQVYMTLSLTDIKESVKLDSEKEAEQSILRMIETGELCASINQEQGTVSFDEDIEQFNTLEMVARIDRHIQNAIALNKKVASIDESIVTSPQFIQRSIRENEMRNGTGFAEFDDFATETNLGQDRPSMR